jgi:cell division protein FtsZ
VEYFIFNADHEALKSYKCSRKVFLERNTEGEGLDWKKGLRWGGYTDIRAEDVVREILKDSDIAFVVAGMEGTRGTEGAPFIARISKETGLFTIVIITRPFPLDEKTRFTKAQKEIEEIEGVADITLLIPGSQSLKMEMESHLIKALKLTSELIAYSIIIFSERLWSADYIFEGRNGVAFIGIGEGVQVQEAMREAISCSLLENDALSRARKVLNSIIYTDKTTLHEIDDGAALLHKRLAEDVIISTALMELSEKRDKPMVILIATNLR